MLVKKCFCLICAVLFFCTGIKTNALSTKAAAACVINGESGEVIYGENCDTRLPMASTTKIMTALLLCEYGDLSKEITVTKEMATVEGSSMGLLPGDKVTLHDLLYGMMLASGNDAANTTAIVIGGSVQHFVEMMNQKAATLGLTNTHFVTPSGLDAQEHYTTAHELALIAAYALKNAQFAQAAASKSAVLCYGNPPYRRTLTNHNRILNCYAGAIGVKTGFTKKSGRCLVSAAKRDGKTVIAVTLKDPDDWDDAVALLDYGLSKIETIACQPPFHTKEIPVVGGTVDNISVSLNSVSVNKSNENEVTARVELPEFLYAPLKNGTVIGKVSYYCGDKLIKSVNITAPQDVGATTMGKLNRILENFKNILSCI